MKNLLFLICCSITLFACQNNGSKSNKSPPFAALSTEQMMYLASNPQVVDAMELKERLMKEGFSEKEAWAKACAMVTVMKFDIIDKGIDMKKLKNSDPEKYEEVTKECLVIIDKLYQRNLRRAEERKSNASMVGSG